MILHYALNRAQLRDRYSKMFAPRSSQLRAASGRMQTNQRHCFRFPVELYRGGAGIDRHLSPAFRALHPRSQTRSSSIGGSNHVAKHFFSLK